MNKMVCAWAAGWMLLAAQAVADVNVVVPGKSAGYLYLPDSGQSDGKASLRVTKNSADGKPLFQNYRIESDPAGLQCDEQCVEAVHNFPAGQVELKIVGNKPIPGLTIPLKGIWSADCHETQQEVDTCVFTLNEANGQISVKVDGDLEPGTIIELGGSSVMYIAMDSAQGYLLVAAHDQLGASMTLMEHDPGRTSDPQIKDSADGRNNMAKLIEEGSNAAQYCQDMGNGWYLPAKDELAKLEGSVLNQVPGLNQSLWSSTEYSFEYKPKDGKWKYKTYYLSRSSSTGNGSISNMTAYEYEGGKKSKDKKESRQVLCFRRVPL